MSTSGNPNDSSTRADDLSLEVTQDGSMGPTSSFGSIGDQNSTALDSEKSHFQGGGLLPPKTLSYSSSGTATENTVDAKAAEKAIPGVPQAEQGEDGTDQNARDQGPLAPGRKRKKPKRKHKRTSSFGSIGHRHSTAHFDSEKSLFEEDLVPVKTLSYPSIDDESGTAIENTVEAREAGNANEEEGNGTDPNAGDREPPVKGKTYRARLTARNSNKRKG
ncbi:hypothetical protein QFC19_006213 [Naganishia cerealis]|uniref:Uncharacterized protein n=1 Tax=Naganishia cerealis TaxID=610337 RepID=A0ACC2VHI8_9TREE|nr:hypothetical protein QFC19_006213 [Naganishia cerealis]